MLTRRTLIFSASIGAALVAAGPQVWAQGRATDATRFIDDFGKQLVAIVNRSGSKAQKLAAMKPLIEQDVAIDDIGQFVLGQYWRVATPAQRQKFLAVFHQVLLNNIGGKLGEFEGVTYRMTRTEPRGGDYLVGTVITRPNQQPNNVQWVVNYASGQPKIVDVYAEGTSLRLTQRSDYTSFLARNGNDVGTLISALERQVAA